MLEAAQPELNKYLYHLLRQVDVPAVIDIVLVSVAIYYLLVLAQGTRAMQLLKGLAILLVIMKLSQWMEMDTLHWILGQAIFASAVVVVILFQPELRAALDQLGRGHLESLGLHLTQLPDAEVVRSVAEITEAVEQLSASRTGALIVVVRETGIEDLVRTGHLLDARLSSELLMALFYQGNPLHDGAVVVRRGVIVAAGCILPLSQEPMLPKSVGTRHRAALGQSECSDAIVVVVSEETGNISLAQGGTMTSMMQPRFLQEEMLSLLGTKQGAPRLRPFARSVGRAARAIPGQTIGTLRDALKRTPLE